MMQEKPDGAVFSRLVGVEEKEFTNDDCGICACEPDGKLFRWKSHECPGEPGDILEFFRGTYLHYGVKVDSEYVVHMTGDGPVKWKDIASSASENAIIKKELFSKVARGSLKVQVWNKYDDRYQPYPPEKIVKRALSNTGRRGYHVLFLNCEHFSNWCRYGISMSHQAEVVGTAAAAVGGAAAGSIAGPIGVTLGFLSGVAVATLSTLWRHRKEYRRVRNIKRSVSTALMPSVLLSEENVQSLQNSITGTEHECDKAKEEEQ